MSDLDEQEYNTFHAYMEVDFRHSQNAGRYAGACSKPRQNHDEYECYFQATGWRGENPSEEEYNDLGTKNNLGKGYKIKFGGQENQDEDNSNENGDGDISGGDGGNGGDDNTNGAAEGVNSTGSSSTMHYLGLDQDSYYPGQYLVYGNYTSSSSFHGQESLLPIVVEDDCGCRLCVKEWRYLEISEDAGEDCNMVSTPGDLSNHNPNRCARRRRKNHQNTRGASAGNLLHPYGSSIHPQCYKSESQESQPMIESDHGPVTGFRTDGVSMSVMPMACSTRSKRRS
ncbi:hypothetical protein NHQ30_003792 [Ciborinia camelliae]|nr:hypothetical protein NHQ30_003792 [Ciborinia camelliae]